MNEPVVRERTIRCPIDHAFRVFTAELDSWWPHGHRRFEMSRLFLEPKEGGRFVERNESGDEALLGEVLLFDPPNRLTYTWYPGAISGPTTVDVLFSETEDGTLVRIVHSEGDSMLGEAWSGRAIKFGSSWDEVIPAFARAATGTTE